MDFFPNGSTHSNEVRDRLLHCTQCWHCTAASRGEVLSPESTTKGLRVLVFKGGTDAPDQGVIRGNPGYPTGKQRGRESKPTITHYTSDLSNFAKHIVRNKASLIKTQFSALLIDSYNFQLFQMNLATMLFNTDI